MEYVSVNTFWRLACCTFCLSETCYRYRPKLSDENALIADWLVALTDARKMWGFEVGRRLFVLNICDGGGAATNGGIHRLALAPMLAIQNQATISHHWPVRPPVAGAFGTILAGYLTQNMGFFAAFGAAIPALRGPLADVSGAVSALVPDLDMIQRIENSGEDTENIFNWGSPCFYQ